jgi:hypothetical protein
MINKASSVQPDCVVVYFGGKGKRHPYIAGFLSGLDPFLERGVMVACCVCAFTAQDTAWNRRFSQETHSRSKEIKS